MRARASKRLLILLKKTFQTFSMENKFILGLHEAGIRDIERVGGKNASLGEMIQHLTRLGIRIPCRVYHNS